MEWWVELELGWSWVVGFGVVSFEWIWSGDRRVEWEFKAVFRFFGSLP